MSKSSLIFLGMSGSLMLGALIGGMELSAVLVGGGISYVARGVLGVVADFLTQPPHHRPMYVISRNYGDIPFRIVAWPWSE